MCDARQQTRTDFPPPRVRTYRQIHGNTNLPTVLHSGLLAGTRMSIPRISRHHPLRPSRRFSDEFHLLGVIFSGTLKSSAPTAILNLYICTDVLLLIPSGIVEVIYTVYVTDRPDIIIIIIFLTC